MDTIDTLDEILVNVLTFDTYKTSKQPKEREFYRERLKLGKIFVAVPHISRMVFCPSRFVGYISNTMEKHVAFEYKSGSITTPRISSVLRHNHEPNPAAEKQYLALCDELGVTPSRKTRSFWVIKNTNMDSVVQIPKTSAGSGYPDDVNQAVSYPEGAVRQVSVNAYERNSKARGTCVKHYGTNCAICDFDFELTYGDIGKDFIHVHHLIPLALRNAEYEVDPINDLRPVCPNCHAMLHKSDPPFSIDELRELMASRK